MPEPQPPPHAPSSPQSTTPGPRLDGLSNGRDVREMAVGGASLLLLVTLFLPWYRYAAAGHSVSFSPLNSAAGGWRVLILIACLSIVGSLAVRIVRSRPRLALPRRYVLVVATVVNMLLAAVAFNSVPTKALGGFAVFVHATVIWGAYIGVLAALAALVSAWLYVRQPGDVTEGLPG